MGERRGTAHAMVGLRQHPPGAITQAVLASGGPDGLPLMAMPIACWPSMARGRWWTATDSLSLGWGPQGSRHCRTNRLVAHGESNLLRGAWQACGLLDRTAVGDQHVHRRHRRPRGPWAVNNLGHTRFRLQRRA